MAYMEGGNYHIQTYLSAIQHKNSTPYKFVLDLFQMTWTRLILGVCTTLNLPITEGGTIQATFTI